VTQPLAVERAPGNLPVTKHHMASIGEAGVFDGIFLIGIIAPLLAR